jgi:choice-of-anchor B domain-containing protein
MGVGCVSFVRRVLALASVFCVAALGSAQFESSNVSMLFNIEPAGLGATAGNDCWGYVSPSGREYAIVGLNNRVAFVEVTNPNSPVILETIPHTSSTWCDIKVYQHYAYAVTEATGTGIQVIDMSDIDNGNVTLVRTITSPGRTHNLALDPVSGYLYTCGSRDGTGTTMCFSLADPADPVRVGANSMSGTTYQHDAIVVTYTEGPYAGRQILFGFSENRGVDIRDVTDKNAPVLIKRATYPSMRYCHQGWLSADRRYLYVDDETDEGGLGINTRTLVFDVANLDAPVYLTNFSSGMPASDHNQYWDDGFLFQANYKSGLRIFDVLAEPVSPPQSGWFDTHPETNSSGYLGAWSVYPYFPSGTVIVSDINRGLFVFDATEATTRNIGPSAHSLFPGRLLGGTVDDLEFSDDQKMNLESDYTGSRGNSPIQLVLEGTSLSDSPLKLRFKVESSTALAGVVEKVELYDFVADAYVEIGSREIGSADSGAEFAAAGNVSRFLQPGTKKLKVRLKYDTTSPNVPRTWTVSVDQAIFRATR